MIRYFKFFCTAFIALFVFTITAFAGEGMWIPLLLKSLNESEMKSMGMKMNADDIYSVNHGSLKDAVVHFGGFCTGEVVSGQGLVFTNHHCGYDAIQSHSTMEHNYLQDGYWAKNLNEEIPTPGLFVTFIVRIEDVTTDVLKGLETVQLPAERQSLIDRNINDVRSRTTKTDWQDVMVRPFFEGNQYFLFVTETYRDVRYVGSPPESIGKFGADTDNWVWPRHTGDFSVFRIYAGPDNMPAEYSPNNKPYVPKHFFPISLDGVDEGDFTLVFGFPGRTYQYLPSFAVEQTEKTIDPVRVGVRDISLGIMDKHMRQDPAIRLMYAPKYAGISNSWKKWIGEMQGLAAKHAVTVKQGQENDFLNRIHQNPEWKNKYGQLLPEMQRLYAELDPVIQNRTLYAEVLGGANIELFRLTSYADRLVKAYRENGDEGFTTMAKRVSEQLGPFFEEYNPEIDREVFDAIMPHFGRTVSPPYLPEEFKTHDMSRKMGFAVPEGENIYNGTILTDEAAFTQALKEGGDVFSKKMEVDAAYQCYMSLRGVLDTKLSPPYVELNDKIQPLQSDYVKALMTVYPERRFWPDANSTLRVSYGQVESYHPRDAVTYNTQTYLEGVMEKYKPGDYEFDVDPRLIDLYQKKDYGMYGENGKMPVAFIASNHTTGGNSGSPAIDAYGNLIGINFDRVWEGTMSDLFYDKSICRNIMVDIRYVLFVMDKLGGAGYLTKELQLVHPKHGKHQKENRRKK